MARLRIYLHPAILVAVVCLIAVIPAQPRAADSQSLLTQYADEIKRCRESVRLGNYGSEEKTQLMQELLDELENKLEARAEGLVGGLPPLGLSNAVDDFRILSDGMGKYWAQWTYRNAGDYNLDGAVGIADVEQLLWNYGAAAGEESWGYKHYCDGNNDGVVDLRDVEPVADNFGNRIDYFRVVGHAYLSPDEAAMPGTPDVIVLGTAPVQEPSPSSSEQSHYYCELDLSRKMLTSLGALQHIWVEPVVLARGVHSNTTRSEELTAWFFSHQLSGAVSSAFHVGFSNLLGGVDQQKFQQEWDLDGDGVFGEIGGEYSYQPTTTRPELQFTEPYCRLVSVRLSKKSVEKIARIPIAVYEEIPLKQSSAVIPPTAVAQCVKVKDGWWRLRYSWPLTKTMIEERPAQTITEFSADRARACADCLIGDRPVAAYATWARDGDTASVYVVSALDNTGERWSEPVLLTAKAVSSFHGPSVELMELDGRPAVAYQRWTEADVEGRRGQALVFQRATDASGTSWDEPSVVLAYTADEMHYEIAGITGEKSLPLPFILKLIGGRPALLLFDCDYASEFMSLTQASDTAGTSWGEPRYVVWTGPMGSAMSHRPATYIWEFTDWQGQPVFLSSVDSGGYYPKYSFELIREIDGEFKATDIRQLDFDGEYPFFGSRGEIVQGADEQVVIAIHTADTTAEDTAIADTDTTNMAEDAAKEDAAAPPPSLALVSLRNLPGNQVKLRAAYTADGQSWRMTPEYDFSDNATLAYFLSAQIKLLPDEQPSADSGDPVSWLELYLGADTPRGPQLWLTRIRLQ